MGARWEAVGEARLSENIWLAHGSHSAPQLPAAAAVGTMACPVILRSLSAICGEDLQLYDLATVTFDAEETRSCYLCIGRHRLFFVAKEMDKLVDGSGSLSYLCIEKAFTDSTTRGFFLLQLSFDVAPRCPGVDLLWDADERILVDSQIRELLLERIAQCWQTECMFRTFEVKRFPLAKAAIGKMISHPEFASRALVDSLQVHPFRGYEADFSYKGYSLHLRRGFKAAAGLRNGAWLHESGWQVNYSNLDVDVPPGVEVTLHVDDVKSMASVDASTDGSEDLRTVAAAYKHALVGELGQFYVLANSAYMKRMNLATDIASWDGWEFCVRAEDALFVGVVFRREHIPPLCFACQDMCVLLRCPTTPDFDQYTAEVLIDECRFIADSLSPTDRVRDVHRTMIQARLDSLHCIDENYRWLEGQLEMVPVHRKTAVQFLKSVIAILVKDQLLLDIKILNAEVFREVAVLASPFDAVQELVSDADALLGRDVDLRDEKRNSWSARIASYFAYCLDGGILGDRFTLATLLGAITKISPRARDGETWKVMKEVVDFLLHAVRRTEAKMPGAQVTPLVQLVQNPEKFGDFTFNKIVLRTLLVEGFLASEWKRFNQPAEGGARFPAQRSQHSYEQVLAVLLLSPDATVSLKTLICRQILENTRARGDDEVTWARDLVPALVKVMDAEHTSLAACATATLVNLSCGSEAVKTILVQQGALRLCMKHLRSKDDDTTLYTLYLLVNLTKAPHVRAITVGLGAVALLVDILTSSYQNPRKHKILTEVASVIGHLSNDAETRVMLCEDYPVVLCFLWLHAHADPNTKLKAKLLFALRQLCGSGTTKITVGRQCIPDVIEQLARASPKHMECAVGAVMLLLTLAAVNSNAQTMNREGRLDRALEQCGLQKNGKEGKHGFGAVVWEKVELLKERVYKAQFR